MVSKSRKKSKGRERKAKKEEAARERSYNNWKALARGKVRNGSVVVVQCDHGFECGDGVSIPDDSNHPVCAFLNAYFMSGKDWYNTLTAYKTTVFMNSNNREMVLNILISAGTNMILYKRLSTDEEIRHVRNVAMTITVIDHFDGVSIESTICSREVAPKLRKLSYEGNDLKRDLLKVFYKRIVCSCLDDMYSEARNTLRKLGACSNCRKVTERALLDVCSKCMIVQYCSRECQVAAWPSHRDLCGEW